MAETNLKCISEFAGGPGTTEPVAQVVRKKPRQERRQQSYSTVAPLTNVALLVELTDRVVNRRLDLPGIGVFHGYSGLGKTFAAAYTANKYKAILIELEEDWTKKTFCKVLLEEMGDKPKGTIADMVRKIQENLVLSRRPLIIDEADHLLTRKMIETVRSIHDKSKAPVILIGEEQLPQRLQEWERVHGRIRDWVSAQPGTMDDLKHLAPIYAPGVELEESFKEILLEASRNSIRRLCVNLADVSEFAAVNDLGFVGAADWGDRTFHDGVAPMPRRL